MGVGLLELCEKYFGARDFYEVLNIQKTANDKQVKKAYHKLSLLVHPDRVEEKVKEEATEKFKVLGKIHSILSDSEKRKVYDETGEFDEDSDEFTLRNWSDYWRTLFKPITVQDINNYKKDYKGSDMELKDLKRAYVDSQGDMDYILEAVPFTSCEEEPRLRNLIQDLVDKEEVEIFDGFFNEDDKKKEKRQKRWAKEAKEAAKLEKEMQKKNGGANDTDDLALMIQNRNKQRAAQADKFFDSLLEKYGNDDKPASKRAKATGTKVTKKRKT